MKTISYSLVFLSILILAGCQRASTTGTPRAETHPGRVAKAEADLARAELGPYRTIGQVEPFALIHGSMPTGVAVSREGRVFLNFPRWGDPVDFTVAELRDGKLTPYPNAEINRLDPEQVEGFVSAQSVVIDAQDRLWILDTGSINFQPIKPGAGKLICVDLTRNQIVKTIKFPENVALSTTYLNDVRFDLERGTEGFAFISDSSDSGPNGIIVVDLASGESWRKLNDHPSAKADDRFIPNVEGRPLMARVPGHPEAYLRIGIDGIAIDPARKVLYYCPLASRRLYSVSVDALANRDMSDEEVAATVKDLGTRQFASDGLECDRQGRLYLTDYEHNAVQRRNDDGQFQIIAQDPRMIWPDSLAFGPGGDLYLTANQLNRQPRFHRGQDLRQPPYVLFRVPRVARQSVAAR